MSRCGLLHSGLVPPLTVRPCSLCVATPAVLIGNFVTLATGGHAGHAAGVAISQPALLGIYAAVLILLGLVNTVTVRALGVVGEISGTGISSCRQCCRSVHESASAAACPRGRWIVNTLLAQLACCRVGCSTCVAVHVVGCCFATAQGLWQLAHTHSHHFVSVCVCAVRAVWWHVIAGTAFVALLPAIAPIHQSASWVFTTFSPDKAFTGIDNSGFLFLLSLLGSQWAMGKSCL